MNVRRANEIAKEWVLANHHRYDNYVGAMIRGSTVWTPPEALWDDSSDVDISIYVDQDDCDGAGKDHYSEGVLLEVSLSPMPELDDLRRLNTSGNCHRFVKKEGLLHDPYNRLSPVQTYIQAHYEDPEIIAVRLESLYNKALNPLKRLSEFPRDDFLPMFMPYIAMFNHNACLYHLRACRNTTFRRCMVLAAEIAEELGCQELYAELLNNFCPTDPGIHEVRSLLEEAMSLWQEACKVHKTRFFFDFKINPEIEGNLRNSIESIIDSGHHIEAMLWIFFVQFVSQQTIKNDGTDSLKERAAKEREKIFGAVGIRDRHELNARGDKGIELREKTYRRFLSDLAGA